MVLSVVAASVTFAGTVAADHDEHDVELADGERATVWLGQTLLYDGESDGNVYEIRTADENVLVAQVEATGGGHVVVETDVLEPGAFYLTGPGIADGSEPEFEVAEQALDVTADPAAVANAGSDAEADFDLQSNRNSYAVEVTAEDLDASDLEAVFGDGPHYVETTDDGVVLAGANDRTVTGDFGDVAPGRYDLQFDVVDSTATATAEVSVAESGEDGARLTEAVMVEERGDVVELSVDFTGTATSATLTVGDAGDVNYEYDVEVTAANPGGQATVLWNTARSADGGGFAAGEGAADVAVTEVDGVSRPIQSGEYPVDLALDGEEVDIATVVIEQRQTEGASTHTAPAAAEDPTAAVEAASSADVGDAVAVSGEAADWVLVRVEASGLEGYVESAGDLTGADGVTLTVEENESTVGTEEEPVALPVDETTLVTPGEDTYVVAVPASALTDRGAEPGDEFVATFRVSEDNPVTHEERTATATFTLVEGTAAFDQDPLYVPASGDASVAGTSTWAPGTNLAVQLRSSDGESPFTKTDDATVAEDGTWKAAFDLSGASEGQDLTARLSHDEAGTQHEVTGGVGEPGDFTPSPTATPTPDPTDTPADGAQAPGFGSVVALLALFGVILLVRRGR